MAEKTAKKPNILKRIWRGIIRFFRDTKGEMKKVVWPSRKQVRNNLIIVLIFVAVAALLIFLLDFAFGHLLKFVLDTGAKIGDEAAGGSSSSSTLVAVSLFFPSILA